MRFAVLWVCGSQFYLGTDFFLSNCLHLTSLICQWIHLCTQSSIKRTHKSPWISYNTKREWNWNNKTLKQTLIYTVNCKTIKSLQRCWFLLKTRKFVAETTCPDLISACWYLCLFPELCGNQYKLNVCVRRIRSKRVSSVDRPNEQSMTHIFAGAWLSVCIVCSLCTRISALDIWPYYTQVHIFCARVNCK